MVKQKELIPGRYYEVIFESSGNTYTVVATSSRLVKTISRNGKRYESTGSLSSGHITEITRAEALLGKKELSNREAVEFLDKEW